MTAVFFVPPSERAENQEPAKREVGLVQAHSLLTRLVQPRHEFEAWLAGRDAWRDRRASHGNKIYREAFFPPFASSPLKEDWVRQYFADRKGNGSGSVEAAFDRVNRAVYNTPRDLFLTPAARHVAYEDGTPRIFCRYHLPDACFTAQMLAIADIRPGDRVLHIGASTGWITALARELTGELGRVTALERELVFCEFARQTLSRANRPAEIVHSHGFEGHLPSAPYDVILVSEGVRESEFASMMNRLSEQAAPGARILVPRISETRPRSEMLRLLWCDEGGRKEHDVTRGEWRPMVNELSYTVPSLEEVVKELEGDMWFGRDPSVAALRREAIGDADPVSRVIHAAV